MIETKKQMKNHLIMLYLMKYSRTLFICFSIIRHRFIVFRINSNLESMSL